MRAVDSATGCSRGFIVMSPQTSTSGTALDMSASSSSSCSNPGCATATQSPLGLTLSATDISETEPESEPCQPGGCPGGTCSICSTVPRVDLGFKSTSSSSSLSLSMRDRAVSTVSTRASSEKNAGDSLDEQVSAALRREMCVTGEKQLEVKAVASAFAHNLRRALIHDPRCVYRLMEALRHTPAFATVEAILKEVRDTDTYKGCAVDGGMCAASDMFRGVWRSHQRYEGELWALYFLAESSSLSALESRDTSSDIQVNLFDELSPGMQEELGNAVRSMRELVVHAQEQVKNQVV